MDFEPKLAYTQHVIARCVVTMLTCTCIQSFRFDMAVLLPSNMLRADMLRAYMLRVYMLRVYMLRVQS